MTAEHKSFYVHFNGSAHFVKEASFFMEQGGLREKWGKAWVEVMALDIEDARRVSAKLDWSKK